jgi:hypothetical protein
MSYESDKYRIRPIVKREFPHFNEREVKHMTNLIYRELKGVEVYHLDVLKAPETSVRRFQREINALGVVVYLYGDMG